MTRDIGDGVVFLQGLAKLVQLRVLCVLKQISLKAFEFDADRVVVAIAAPTVFGCPSVPSAVVGADKLPQTTIAADEKVRRHTQTLDLQKVGVRLPVKLVGKERGHFGPAILAGRQADRVDHQQINAGAFRSGAMVGRIESVGRGVPAMVPKLGVVRGRCGHGASAAQSAGLRSWAAVRCSVLQ